ncbi:hypothetical protein HZS_16 [Henneguya salminicola]|nr:hypothetical protein HZS_16 [Henneguya salminicola]
MKAYLNITLYSIVKLIDILYLIKYFLNHAETFQEKQLLQTERTIDIYKLAESYQSANQLSKAGAKIYIILTAVEWQ